MPRRGSAGRCGACAGASIAQGCVEAQRKCPSVFASVIWLEARGGGEAMGQPNPYCECAFQMFNANQRRVDGEAPVSAVSTHGAGVAVSFHLLKGEARPLSLPDAYAGGRCSGVGVDRGGALTPSAPFCPATSRMRASCSDPRGSDSLRVCLYLIQRPS